MSKIAGACPASSRSRRWWSVIRAVAIRYETVTIRSTQLVSQPLTGRGTISVPMTLRAAEYMSSTPTMAAMTRPASGTTMALLEASRPGRTRPAEARGSHAGVWGVVPRGRTVLAEQ